MHLTFIINTSVDFITNSLKFIDRESRDPEVDIHNWDAHIILLRKGCQT